MAPNTNSLPCLVAYIVLYSLLILSLYYVVKVSTSAKINTASLSSIHSHIMRFSRLRTLYVALILNLTGLPPFILFFIKFNYLLETFSRIDFICAIIVYIVFFLHMLFYAQTWVNKRVNFDEIIFTKKKDHISFRVVFFITGLLYLSTLSVLFLPDVYVISSLLFL